MEACRQHLWVKPGGSVSSTPMEVQQGSAGLSQIERVTNTFFAPSKTMADIRANASFWLPWVLITIFTLGFYWTVGEKVTWNQAMMNMVQKSPKAMQRIDQIPPDKKADLPQMLEKQGKAVTFIAPVTRILGMLIAAAGLLAVFNFGFGTHIEFKRMLAIVTYASLPLLVEKLLAMGTLFAGLDTEGFFYTNPIGTNIAFYLDMSKVGAFLYGVLASFDIITIWMIFLMGLGVSLNSKVKTLTAALTIAAVYGVVVVISASVGAAFN